MKLIVPEAVRIIPRPILRGMAQPGSAPALGAGGRGFKSLCPDQCGVSPGHYLEMRPELSRTEQRPSKLRVAGSSPAGRAKRH